MATLLKPKVKKQTTSLALSPDLLNKVSAISKATGRLKSELAQTFLKMGLEAFEKQVVTDALLYDVRKEGKDVLLKNCEDILRRIRKMRNS